MRYDYARTRISVHYLVNARMKPSDVTIVIQRNGEPVAVVSG
jgi:hypothetical protein